MRWRWQSIFLPSGEWYWWVDLPNGWTAWVIDDTRGEGQAIYRIIATSGAMRKAFSVPFFTFTVAKSKALSLALAQVPRVCKTVRIET